MTNREALERIKRLHHVAMAMLCDGRKDEETENAIKIIEQVLDRLEELEEEEKNAKLKKAIEILKTCIFVIENHQSIILVPSYEIEVELTKEEYNILKEVLGDE